MPTRNPDNVNIWIDANVYVTEDPTAVPPATIDAELAAAWLLVGILDGGDGFGEDRAWNESKHFGWGIGLIRKSFSQFELTRTFTALEDNPTTRKMLYPGSTDTVVKVPRPAELFVCFETISDVGGKERLFTKRKATTWCSENNRNESDLTKFPFSVSVYADGANELFTRQATAAA